MANRFHAENRWVENLRLKWIKNSTEVCQTEKSFWTGDVEDVTGSFPVESNSGANDSPKPMKWWSVAGCIIEIFVAIVFGADDAGKLRRFPRLRFRDGGDYYIDEKSEYDRLMSILKE